MIITIIMVISVIMLYVCEIISLIHIWKKSNQKVDDLKRRQEEDFKYFQQKDYLTNTNFLGTLKDENVIENYKAKCRETTRVIKFDSLEELIKNGEEDRRILISFTQKTYETLKAFEEVQKLLDKYNSEKNSKKVIISPLTSNTLVSSTIDNFVTKEDFEEFKKENKKK